MTAIIIAFLVGAAVGVVFGGILLGMLVNARGNCDELLTDGATVTSFSRTGRTAYEAQNIP